MQYASPLSPTSRIHYLESRIHYSDIVDAEVLTGVAVLNVYTCSLSKQ